MSVLVFPGKLLPVGGLFIGCSSASPGGTK